MMTFLEYLRSIGKEHVQGQERKDLHVYYQQEIYFKTYNKNRKSDAVQVRFWLKKNEHQRLMEQAEALELKINSYIKMVLKAYKNASYVLPDHVVLHDLIISLSRLGCNLNQLAFICNKKKDVTLVEIEKVKTIFNQIEKETLAHFKPFDLRRYVKKQACIHPEIITELEAIITDFKNGTL